MICRTNVRVGHLIVGVRNCHSWVNQKIMVKNNKELDEGEWSRAGQRFEHILDKIRFQSGYGRTVRLHKYLMETLPDEFGDISYSTIKAWFQDNSPTMARMDKLVYALQKHYAFPGEIARIKTWWKVGGEYPFNEVASRAQTDRLKMQVFKQIILRLEKLEEVATTRELQDLLDKCLLILGYIDNIDLTPDMNEIINIIVSGVIANRLK